MQIFQHREFKHKPLFWVLEYELTTMFFPVQSSNQSPILNPSSKAWERWSYSLDARLFPLHPVTGWNRLPLGCVFASVWRNPADCESVIAALDIRWMPPVWHFCVTRLHTCCYWPENSVRNEIQNFIGLTDGNEKLCY